MRLQPCSADATTNANAAPSLPLYSTTTTMEDLIQCSAFSVKPQRRSFLAGTVDSSANDVDVPTTTTTTTLADHQCELASRRWSANDWTNLPFMPLEHCCGGAAVYTLQPRPSVRAKTLVLLSPHGGHGCATCTTTATSTHPQQQQQSLIWLDSHGPPQSNSTTTRRPRPWPTTDHPTSTSRENPWTYDLDDDGGEENNYHSSTTQPESADHHRHNRKRRAGRLEPGGPSLAWPLQDDAEPNSGRLFLLPRSRIKRHRRRHGTTTTTAMAPPLPHF